MIIKFITLNLNQGILLDEAIAFIKKESPDIVGLQEVYNETRLKLANQFHSLEILQRELPYQYHFYSPAIIHVRKEGKIEQGNAIFSKFPIVEQYTSFFAGAFGEANLGVVEEYQFYPRNLQQAVIHNDHKMLHVFNTQGVWNTNGRDNPTRLRMSRHIVNQVKEKEHVILAGDFNVEPDTQTIQNIEAHLVNVFKGELTTTFNMNIKKGGGYKTSVVDMVFVSNDITVVEHSCPQVNISDHLPLVCTFELRN